MRYFQKAFRRTDINVLYSKGFSPHMIMSFAQPLGVGVESLGEYFDVEVDDNENVSLFVDKLNEQMADGIVVHDAVILPEKCENAMASVKAADYEIDFYSANPLNNELISKFNDAPEVFFEKTTKTGTHLINVKDFVFSIGIKEEHILCCKVDCSSAGNLKPVNLCSALLSLDNKLIDNYPIHVTRIETYKVSDDGAFVPLNVF